MGLNQRGNARGPGVRAQGSPCSHVSPCRFLAVRTEGSGHSRMVMEVGWTTWMGRERRWPQTKRGCVGLVPESKPFWRLLTPLELSHAARSPPAAPTRLGSTVLAFGCPTAAVRAAQGRGGCWAHPCTALICGLTTVCLFSRCHQSWLPVAVILIPKFTASRARKTAQGAQVFTVLSASAAEGQHLQNPPCR